MGGLEQNGCLWGAVLWGPSLTWVPPEQQQWEGRRCVACTKWMSVQGPELGIGCLPAG